MSLNSNPFDNLDYEQFRQMAKNPQLSEYEKIGFPDDYRQGHDDNILADIVAKLKLDQRKQLNVIDIGCGCSSLTHCFIRACSAHNLVCVDSSEMLQQLGDVDADLVDGKFPESPDLSSIYPTGFDAILLYSVYQYIYPAVSVADFIDHLFPLMRHGAIALIGDLPNRSMRNRFFANPEGLACHQKYTGDCSSPPIVPVDKGDISDEVVLKLLCEARRKGLHAFVVPQDPSLPMANRREDIVIWRP